MMTFMSSFHTKLQIVTIVLFYLVSECSYTKIFEVHTILTIFEQINADVHKRLLFQKHEMFFFVIFLQNVLTCPTQRQLLLFFLANVTRLLTVVSV